MLQSVTHKFQSPINRHLFFMKNSYFWVKSGKIFSRKICQNLTNFWISFATSLLRRRWAEGGSQKGPKNGQKCPFLDQKRSLRAYLKLQYCMRKNSPYCAVIFSIFLGLKRDFCLARRPKNRFQKVILQRPFFNISLNILEKIG